ncbi:MAG: DUF456 family protein [Acidimicrobiales bacterium]
MSDGEATLVIGLVMVVGLAGTVVPVLPGLALLWAAGLTYGFLVGFGPIGIGMLVAFTAIVGLSVAKSFILPRRMAEGSDVSLWSQLAAIAGAIVGFFVVPIIGVVLGALVGLFSAEWVKHRRVGPAWVGTKAVGKAFGLSALIDVGLGLVMFALWLAWAVAVL